MIKIISHRGNINGPDPRNENNPSQIMLAISKGFDVEIDFWEREGKLFLGHDVPQYEIDYAFLNNIKDKLWIHCKNFYGLKYLQEKQSDLNYFWHEKDSFTITSLGYVWTYPSNATFNGSVIVDLTENPNKDIEAFGICTDYPERLM